MDDMLEFVGSILPDGWEIDDDGYGFDFLLICPHGELIEQDGRCYQGCVSPLRALGLI